MIAKRSRIRTSLGPAVATVAPPRAIVATAPSGVNDRRADFDGVLADTELRGAILRLRSCRLARDRDR